MRYSAAVVVIGGGATGVGVLRDLAMRGYSAILVERGDLASGTTGRFHGLLHSGARYVVSDPQTAKECAGENSVLARIHEDAVELTGGYFVSLPQDDPSYAERFTAGAAACQVPVTEIDTDECLRAEPRLNPAITRAFSTCDQAIDGWAMVTGTACSAIEYGAKVLTYHQVQAIQRVHGQVVAVVCRDLKSDAQVEIECNFVINAAGVWAAQVAELAGISDIGVVAGRGIMIAMAHRLVHSVISRCRYPSDGDLLVPAHTVTIIGTTDKSTANLDRLEIPAGEVQEMLDAGEALVPGFRQTRALRAWAGGRPLVQDHNLADADTRGLSRSMIVINHKERDHLSGMITVIGGKLSTYRLMAAQAVDLMCAQLGESRLCRTDQEAVPATRQRQNARLDERFATREQQAVTERGFDDQLICECELVTKGMLQQVLIANPTASFDDVRRLLRLGMGPCQGGFCALRAAGIAAELAQGETGAANVRLAQFIANRWGGQQPILYGDQLRQVVLDMQLQHGILNIPQLGGNGISPNQET
ncbi:MAG: anaerobic glycerol-3-phosphate dehydrogenase subunit GlpA [Propionibacteriaceae bacterium]|nr:anaerobic glycerol-3-phosphate dehydrogenase subunit GlpA [Propionibacteriaceae bacterium]